jgi:RimJ/RimL family protein N-acetyltransferase
LTDPDHQIDYAAQKDETGQMITAFPLDASSNAFARTAFARNAEQNAFIISRQEKNAMIFHISPMTEQDARLICDWRYPPPYDCYRWPPWPQMQREKREFADPDIRADQYLSIREADGTLAAYVQLFPLDRAVRIGLGLRPDLCGHGFGGEVIRLAITEARRRRPRAEIDLEVETWNQRAIRAYQKAGFVMQDQYERRAEHGIVHVLCMVLASD